VMWRDGDVRVLEHSMNNALIVKTIRMTFPSDGLDLNFLVQVEDE